LIEDAQQAQPYETHPPVVMSDEILMMMVISMMMMLMISMMMMMMMMVMMMVMKDDEVIDDMKLCVRLSMTYHITSYQIIILWNNMMEVTTAPATQSNTYHLSSSIIHRIISRITKQHQHQHQHQ